MQDIIAYLNISLVIESMVDAGSTIKDILFSVIFGSPRTIGSIILGISIVGYVYRETKRRLIYEKSQAQQLIDKILFKVGLIVYKESDNLKKKDTDKNIFFSNKHKILQSSKASFIANFTLLAKDIQFIEKIFSIRIVSDDQREELVMQLEKTNHIYILHKAIGNLLFICTLGIGYFRRSSITI